MINSLGFGLKEENQEDTEEKEESQEKEEEQEKLEKQDAIEDVNLINILKLFINIFYSDLFYRKKGTVSLSSFDNIYYLGT